MRAILFSDDDARAVASALVAHGYAAEVTRERLAGEDDDEDHPWAVRSDAPDFVLELLVDEHEGWLDDDDPSPTDLPPPIQLPSEPRRLHRRE